MRHSHSRNGAGSESTAAGSGQGLRTATLQLHNLRKRYSPVDVINDLSLPISRGESIAFVGSLGCGKLERDCAAIGRPIVHTGRALARNTPRPQLVPA
jgi:ABC-type branched-subunit amino acid transport system ATPase component